MYFVLLLPGPISSVMLASGTAPLLQNSRRFEPGVVKSRGDTILAHLSTLSGAAVSTSRASGLVFRHQLCDIYQEGGGEAVAGGQEAFAVNEIRHGVQCHPQGAG